MRSAVLHAAIVLFVLLGGGVPHAQELSTSVYPSEDEVYQALRTGEISFEQYLALQEIISHGLDSTNNHLLDEIPNLSFFASDSSTMSTSLEIDQQNPFTPKPNSSPSRVTLPVSGTLRHRYFQTVDTDRPSKYESTARFHFADKFAANIKLKREYSGRERVISRDLTYHNKTGPLRALTIGNYSKRLGLGTVFGYRGKLLSPSDNLDSESLAYPDYGGHNGALAHLATATWELHSAGSVNRDDHHRLTTIAGQLQRSEAAFQPGFLFALNRIKNRITGQAISDIKYGLGVNYKYARSYTSIELCWQSGVQPSFGAAVAEGTHRFQSAQVKYAGWFYDKDYLDLSAGSKSGNIRHKDQLEEIDFEFSTKRAGQQGGLLKTVIAPSDVTKLASSVIYATFGSDTTDIQWLVELTGKLSRRLSLSLDYLSKSKHRLSAENTSDNSVRRQTRLEARHRDKKLYLRTSLAYNTETDKSDFTSAFFSARYRIESYGTLELWSNITRINHRDLKIASWYGYLRNSFNLSENIGAAIKLSHAFNCDRTDQHETQVSFDVGVNL